MNIKTPILIISILLLTGCATVTPQWKADLNNINRNWRAIITQPTTDTNPALIRAQHQSINICGF